MEKVKTTEKKETPKIKMPAMKTTAFLLRGTAPYVANKFSAEALQMMRDKMEEGSQAKKGKTRDPKDFEKCGRESVHFSDFGWGGIPANSFRQAIISACRLVGFKMTLAKLSCFVEADGVEVRH